MAHPDDHTVPGRWWHRGDDGRVHCDLCPRFCKLDEGQRGFCFVRRNDAGEMVLTTHGKASGFCVDPIEKKPLYHFLPGTSVLSFGTAGCNLGCRFCQNWDISKARDADRLTDAASPERIAAAAVEHGCASVAFTYNDPVIFAEYAIDTAAACRERGVRSVAVSAGYITPEARAALYGVCDGINIDLKAFTDRFYRKLCAAKLDPVLETLRWLRHETDVWFEVTTLLIPGENDSPEEIDRMCGWYVRELGEQTPLHLTAFHPDFRMTDRDPTPSATLQRARGQAKRHGIRHVYTGNVVDPEGQSTVCEGCGSMLIARDWHRLGDYGLDDHGRCRRCQRSLAGVFDGPAGQWGRKRLRVLM